MPSMTLWMEEELGQRGLGKELGVVRGETGQFRTACSNSLWGEHAAKKLSLIRKLLESLLLIHHSISSCQLPLP